MDSAIDLFIIAIVQSVWNAMKSHTIALIHPVTDAKSIMGHVHAENAKSAATNFVGAACADAVHIALKNGTIACVAKSAINPLGNSVSVVKLAGTQYMRANVSVAYIAKQHHAFVVTDVARGIVPVAHLMMMKNVGVKNVTDAE